MTTKAEQLEKMDKFFEDFLADPEKYKKKWTEEARKEHPNMTDEQLEGAWAQLESQFL
jgi:hypothetical protein